MSGLVIIGAVFTKNVWYLFVVNFMQLCIFLSCGFLIDAFRLLSKLKPESQTISKKQASLLSIAFGAFGTAFLVSDLAGFLDRATFTNVSRIV